MASEAMTENEALVKQFSKNLEAFGKELKCPVCIGLMENPYAGACGHPACYQCFVDALRACGKCPVCNAEERKRSLRPSVRFQAFVNAYRALQPQKVRDNLQTQVRDCSFLLVLYTASNHHKKCPDFLYSSRN